MTFDKRSQKEAKLWKEIDALFDKLDKKRGPARLAKPAPGTGRRHLDNLVASMRIPMKPTGRPGRPRYVRTVDEFAQLAAHL